MGQRANLVIVRDGDWRLFYDHWCASRLEVELFWGPQLAVRFIEARAPLEDRGDWLDEVWCEGAAVVNEDTKVLTWFGGELVEHDVPLRRVFLELMKHQWPDWDIRWATGGIVEVGACVRLPAARFLTERERGGTFEVDTEWPDNNETLLTVREGGRTLAARVSGDEEALCTGPALLPELLGLPRSSSLDWVGEMPTGGLHVDVEERRLYYWRANPVCAIERRLREAWPGYGIDWLQDRFDVHLKLAAIDVRLPVRSTRELRADVIAYLRNHHTHEAQNPARALAANIDGVISPWTDEARGSLGRPEDKVSVLDELSRRCLGEGSVER